MILVACGRTAAFRCTSKSWRDDVDMCMADLCLVDAFPATLAEAATRFPMAQHLCLLFTRASAWLRSLATPLL